MALVGNRPGKHGNMIGFRARFRRQNPRRAVRLRLREGFPSRSHTDSTISNIGNGVPLTKVPCQAAKVRRIDDLGHLTSKTQILIRGVSQSALLIRPVAGVAGEAEFEDRRLAGHMAEVITAASQIQTLNPHVDYLYGIRGSGYRFLQQILRTEEIP